jgi:hypothetical protein
MFPKFRRSVVLVLTSALAVSTILSASAASTSKNLSSNFTLVNLFNGSNQGTIKYVKPDGSDWRPEDNPDQPASFTLNGLGAQLERRQYFDAKLPGGSGSVVVSTQGPVGAVVQILARSEITPQDATSGAYIGVSEGSPEANVPLVMRRRNTLSGIANSQIIIQNASTNTINVEVKFYDGVTGNEIAAATKTISNRAQNASFEYDLEEEGNLPEAWYGSAVVRSTTAGGQVAVVSNLFNGDHTMMTYNAFTSFETDWGVPLFASRLQNGLSTPLVIQNKSGSTIPAQGITLACKVATESPNQQATVEVKNQNPILNNAAFFDFNPAQFTDDFPADWYGTCTVDTGTFATALFIQMRTIGKEADGNYRAAAYEGIPLDGTDKTVVIPLYARRLENGFASNATIMNLSTTQPANVTVVYKGKEGSPPGCSATFDRTIPPAGSLLQNHRVEDGVANSVPEVDENCSGTLTVTSSDSAIDAFVQLDILDTIAPPVPPRISGDRIMAHNVFTRP